MGSGNSVHNLRVLNFQQPDKAYAWATRLDADVKRYLENGDDQSLVD